MKRASLIGAAALAMLLGGAVPPGVRALRAFVNSRGAGRSGVGGFIGRGWSVATDRRRARKARNVARNRKAHR